MINGLAWCGWFIDVVVVVIYVVDLFVLDFSLVACGYVGLCFMVLLLCVFGLACVAGGVGLCYLLMVCGAAGLGLLDMVAL